MHDMIETVPTWSVVLLSVQANGYKNVGLVHRLG